MSIISTPITELFGIKHPVLLAGMNIAAGPELAAAVSNAGGCIRCPFKIIQAAEWNRRRTRCHRWSGIHPEDSSSTSMPGRGIPPELEYADSHVDPCRQGRAYGQVPTIWRRPIDSPGRRQCTEDERECRQYFHSSNLTPQNKSTITRRESSQSLLRLSSKRRPPCSCAPSVSRPNTLWTGYIRPAFR
jgi:hypothetical protein